MLLKNETKHDLVFYFAPLPLIYLLIISCNILCNTAYVFFTCFLGLLLGRFLDKQNETTICHSFSFSQKNIRYKTTTNQAFIKKKNVHKTIYIYIYVCVCVCNC